MKLELKHLAPYLPYGLKCELLNYKSDYVGEKYGIINGFYYLGGEVHYTFKDRSTAGKTRDIIKPILRPLSDLTKDDSYILDILTLDGKPNRDIERCKYDGSFIYEKGFRWGVELDGEKNTEWQISVSMFLNGMNVKTYNWLLENHFDVFGLMPQGLAIDINTITS
jgi:hypothetical protein